MNNPTQKTFFDACARGNVAVVCQLQKYFTLRTLIRGVIMAATNVQADVVSVLTKPLCTSVFDHIASHAELHGGDGWLPELVEALGREADCKFLYAGERTTTLRAFAKDLCGPTDEPVHDTFVAAELWRQ